MRSMTGTSQQVRWSVLEKSRYYQEEFIMAQEALGMVETRGLTAAIEAADAMT